jgi:magnesium transporter
VADPTAHPTEIRVVAYDPDEVVEEKLDSVDPIPGYLEKWPVTWINVDGLKDTEVINRLGELFGLHKLALEDVVNVHQRAKVEPYEEKLFIVSRMIRAGDRLDTEQFSMFLGPNYVLTFQEVPGDCFDPVRDRIRKGRKIFRKSGPDYLAYTLVDAIIDRYFPVLEKYDEWMDHLEKQVLVAPRRLAPEGSHQHLDPIGGGFDQR